MKGKILNAFGMVSVQFIEKLGLEFIPMYVFIALGVA